MKKLLSLYFCFWLSVSVGTSIAHSKTTIEILDDIRVKIGDAKTDTNNRHWDQTLLLARLNMVQDYICKKTLCIPTRISTGTIAGKREYTFNSDVIQPIRLAYYITGSDPPAYQRLQRFGVNVLDKDVAAWDELDAGEPTRYYQRGKVYGFSTAPAAAYVSTYAVQIDYYKKADALVNDTDVPFDEDLSLYVYHELLIKGVVIMCLEDERIDTAVKIAEYQFLITEMREDIRAKTDDGIWR